MWLVSYLKNRRFKFDNTCSGDVSKSVNKQQTAIFDKQQITN